MKTIWGSSQNDIWAAGDNSTIIHYNGTDWKIFEEFTNPNYLITDLWTDGKEIFAIGNNSNQTLVFHGKLK